MTTRRDQTANGITQRTRVLKDVWADSAGNVVDQAGNVVIGAAAQALVSPDGIQTWANRGVALAAGLTRCFFTDVGIGGSYWDYLGGRWRPQARRVMLGNLTNEVGTQATVLTAMYAVLIPGGLVQDGDQLMWVTSHHKSGTVEVPVADWRIGTSPTATGSALFLQGSGVNNQVQYHAMHRIRRVSATTVRNMSAPGFTGLGGTTAAIGLRTVPSMDSDTHWQVLGNLNTGAETWTLAGASLWLECGA